MKDASIKHQSTTLDDLTRKAYHWQVELKRSLKKAVAFEKVHRLRQASQRLAHSETKIKGFESTSDTVPEPVLKAHAKLKARLVRLEEESRQMKELDLAEEARLVLVRLLNEARGVPKMEHVYEKDIFKEYLESIQQQNEGEEEDGPMPVLYESKHMTKVKEDILGALASLFSVPSKATADPTKEKDTGALSDASFDEDDPELNQETEIIGSESEQEDKDESEAGSWESDAGLSGDEVDIGSDSDLEVDEDALFVPSLSAGGGGQAKKKKKNRPGQQARRQMWEKMYGEQANHVKQGQRLKQRGPPSRGGQKRPYRPQEDGKKFKHGSEERPFKKSVPMRQQQHPKQEEDKNLHPSWQAKKSQHNQAALVAASGTRIVFDD